MPGFMKKREAFSAPKAADEIEKIVYDNIKQFGFKRYGRTLHRFVSEDISQLINFQIYDHYLIINIGIRVPECVERTFTPSEQKKYYHEYECNIRSELGAVRGKKTEHFNLRRNPLKTSKKITSELTKTVLPVFNILCSREAILTHRREYPLFDVTGSHLILLDEAMIYGRLGNTEKAKELFEEHYNNAVRKYKSLEENGRRYYLKKGEEISFKGQNIIAEKNGYVTVYGASSGHIEYLDRLALKIGIWQSNDEQTT